MPPIKVLIIDDSAVVRASFKKGLEVHPDIEVVGAAPDPFVGRDMIAKFDPQVLVLDIEMPRMDGLTFLKRVMKFKPIPTIIVSSLTPRGTKTALACLDAGAVAVLCKPGAAYSVGDLTTELANVVRTAARTTLTRRVHTPASAPISTGAMLETTNKVIAIGSSTGGTKAIEHVLSVLPRTIPGIVIAQHMPEHFTNSFAERLNTICEIEVREAKDKDVLRPGLALIAPGNNHLHVARSGAVYHVRIKQGPRVCQQRPSVEVMMESVARTVGSNAMGVMLTGMGNDGANAMNNMHEAGSFNVAQDEASCVVYGMPKEAVAAGGVDQIMPLGKIADAMCRFGAGSARSLRKKPKAA
ncbi:MAG: two-component system chemotaxis response regulator CheB [Planctomycetota bacterium]|jgi:two-component system chemotaxis response regulator CheB